MNEWTTGWLRAQTDEWVHGWIHGCIDKGMEEKREEGKEDRGEQINEWKMVEQINRLMDGRMDDREIPSSYLQKAELAAGSLGPPKETVIQQVWIGAQESQHNKLPGVYFVAVKIESRDDRKVCKRLSISPNTCKNATPCAK